VVKQMRRSGASLTGAEDCSLGFARMLADFLNGLAG